MIYAQKLGQKDVNFETILLVVLKCGNWIFTFLKMLHFEKEKMPLSLQRGKLYDKIWRFISVLSTLSIALAPIQRKIDALSHPVADWKAVRLRPKTRLFGAPGHKV